MRAFEQKCNLLFREYTKLYYEGGVGNFFVSESEEGFNCGFFAKKGTVRNHSEVDPSSGMGGCWDSFNTLAVKIDGKGNAVYSLNTTVMVEFRIKNDRVGELDLSGYRREHKQEVIPLPDEKLREDFHIANIGRMIEDMETQMRTDLQLIYISKTQDVIQCVIQIIFNTRYENTRELQEKQRKMAEFVVTMKKE
jgi:capping protein beta